MPRQACNYVDGVVVPNCSRKKSHAHTATSGRYRYMNEAIENRGSFAFICVAFAACLQNMDLIEGRAPWCQRSIVGQYLTASTPLSDYVIIFWRNIPSGDRGFDTEIIYAGVYIWITIRDRQIHPILELLDVLTHDWIIYIYIYIYMSSSCSSKCHQAQW
jgi:hypothetical protein